MAISETQRRPFLIAYPDAAVSPEVLHHTLVGLAAPGQGGQYENIHQPLYDQFPKEARPLWDYARQVVAEDTGEDLFEVLKNPEALTDTRWIQIVTNTSALARNRIRREKGLFPEPRVFVGKSVGEIPMLALAGAMTEEDAIWISNERGKIASEVNRQEPGAMVVLVGVDEEIRKRMEDMGLSVCIYATPEKFVYGGPLEKYFKALAYLNEQSGLEKKVYPQHKILQGAFHHEIMAGMIGPLATALDAISLKDTDDDKIFIAGSTGKRAKRKEEIRAELLIQPDHPVLWHQSLEAAFKHGMGAFMALDQTAQLPSEGREVLGGSRASITAQPEGGGKALVIEHSWSHETTKS